MERREENQRFLPSILVSHSSEKAREGKPNKVNAKEHGYLSFLHADHIHLGVPVVDVLILRRIYSALDIPLHLSLFSQVGVFIFWIQLHCINGILFLLG